MNNKRNVRNIKRTMHSRKGIGRCEKGWKFGELVQQCCEVYDVKSQNRTIWFTLLPFSSSIYSYSFIFPKLKWRIKIHEESQWDTTIHQPGYPKLRLTAPNTGKGGKQSEFSYIIGRSIKWYNHLRKRTGKELCGKTETPCIPTGHTH